MPEGLSFKFQVSSFRFPVRRGPFGKAKQVRGRPRASSTGTSPRHRRNGPIRPRHGRGRDGLAVHHHAVETRACLKERLVLRHLVFRKRRHDGSRRRGQGRAKRRRLCRRCRLLHSHSLPLTRPDRRRISPPAAPVAYSVVHYPIYTTATTVDARAVSECIGRGRIHRVYFRATHRVEFQAAELAPLGVWSPVDSL